MPVRNDVLTNLETKLKEIKVSNGYHTNINLVSRDVKGWEQCNSYELPALFIVDDGTDEKLGYYKVDSTIYVLRKMQIVLLGYVRATKNISVVFNKLFADLEKHLGSVNLGSNVREVMNPDPMMTFTVPPHLIFQMPVTILYFFDKSNP